MSFGPFKDKETAMRYIEKRPWQKEQEQADRIKELEDALSAERAVAERVVEKLAAERTLADRLADALRRHPGGDKYGFCPGWWEHTAKPVLAAYDEDRKERAG